MWKPDDRDEEAGDGKQELQLGQHKDNDEDKYRDIVEGDVDPGQHRGREHARRYLAARECRPDHTLPSCWTVLGQVGK